MSADQIQVVSTGFFLLFSFLSGVWLSRSGRPLNGIILTIHKLISLAATVCLTVTIYQMHQAAGLSGMELTITVVTGLLFLVTGVIGGLLSTDKPMPATLLTTHKVTPFLTVLSTAATLYLLQGR
jgi:hypothetical protein